MISAVWLHGVLGSDSEQFGSGSPRNLTAFGLWYIYTSSSFDERYLLHESLAFHHNYSKEVGSSASWISNWQISPPPVRTAR